MMRTALAGQSCALAGAMAHSVNSASLKALANMPFISPPETPHDGFLAPHMFAGAPQRQAKPDALLLRAIPASPLLGVPVARSMSMGLAILIFGLVLFLGAHVFVSLRAERA